MPFRSRHVSWMLLLFQKSPSDCDVSFHNLEINTHPTSKICLQYAMPNMVQSSELSVTTPLPQKPSQHSSLQNLWHDALQPTASHEPMNWKCLHLQRCKRTAYLLIMLKAVRTWAAFGLHTWMDEEVVIWHGCVYNQQWYLGMEVLVPSRLRCGSAAARLLRIWVLISPGAWTSVFMWVLCVVTYRSLRRSDHSSGGDQTLARRCVWSRNLIMNEEAIARFGPKRHKKRK
jgi:hypothetical protein